MSMKRTDSNLTTDSVASNGSSKSMPVQEEFDCIGEDNNNGQQQVANKRLKKFLGEIGKTRSEADFFNGKPTKSVVKTFKQQNLIKLPSMENDLEAQNRINGLKMLDEVVDVASISRANKYKQ
uniref:Uncharacterized protein n=1 Tax=Rhabditophanes sp. KR3021 TaxID=114890 RepID=A0AC35UG93_9BILA